GAGNIVRGMTIAAKGGDRVIGDHMGMLGTVINSLALGDAIRRAGGKSHVFSQVSMPSICDTFTQRAAIAALEGGATVICAGGTGNPFFTTDTAAALKAIELRCDVLLKGPKVDGVYSADPHKDPTATRFDEISHEEVIAQDRRIRGGSLLGVASAGTARDIRQQVWQHLGDDWKPRQLETICTREAGLADLPDVFATMLGGKSFGRTVVKID